MNDNALRHLTDFTLTRAGAGGYATVFKALSKIDGRTYAVKRIRLVHRRKAHPTNKRVLREAQILSQLTHENIVRYYHAWIEHAHNADDVHSDDDVSESHSHESSMESAALNDIDSGASVDSAADSDFGDDLTCAVCNAPYRDWRVSYSEWSILQSSLRPLNLCEACYRNGLTAMGISAERIQIRRTTLPPLYLFIATEWCESTLEQRIRIIHSAGVPTANSSSSAVLWSYFRQIANAIHFLHSQTPIVIHRDLKPNNILLVKETIKICDLGLATTINSATLPTSPSSKDTLSIIDSSSALTNSVGTSLYIAPEVMSVNGGSYDERCDLYSAGIILFELFQPFHTAMERARTLSALRSEQTLPNEFVQRNPHIAGLITRLLTNDPKQRPSATQLTAEINIISAAVYSDSTSTLSARLERVQAELESARTELVRLQAECDEKDRIIAELLTGKRDGARAARMEPN